MFEKLKAKEWNIDFSQKKIYYTQGISLVYIDFFYPLPTDKSVKYKEFFNKLFECSDLESAYSYYLTYSAKITKEWNERKLKVPYVALSFNELVIVVK